METSLTIITNKKSISTLHNLTVLVTPMILIKYTYLAIENSSLKSPTNRTFSKPLRLYNNIGAS